MGQSRSINGTTLAMPKRKNLAGKSRVTRRSPQTFCASLPVSIGTAFVPKDKRSVPHERSYVRDSEPAYE
jgi:hypothetical protein